MLAPDCEKRPKLPNNAMTDTRLPQTIAAFPAKGSSDAMSNEQTDLMEPLRSLLDTIPQSSSDAIIAADRDGLVRYWNLGAT